MAPQFPKQSTRPLTAESYRRAAAKARELSGTIEDLGRAMQAAPYGLSHPAYQRLTRAIHDLAMHAKRLDDRHRGITGDDNNARQD